MQIFPAIDLIDGQAVRLVRGDYEQKTVYGAEPVVTAKRFCAAGATALHVVDLDGAKSGAADNFKTVCELIEQSGMDVEIGGGIRSLETLKRLADAGAARMVLGTALVNDPELAHAAIAAVGGERLTAGIDAKGGEVAVSGWIEGSGVAASDLARAMGAAGFKHIVYTDIARDGMQTGIDVQAYVDMANAFGNPVIASGGVASLADIERLAPVAESIEGVITGRAVYEGTLDVAAGVALCASLTAGA